MLKSKSQKITTAGMLIAAGIMLPFAVSHGFGMKGTLLLPMHIPVFLIGFLCGPLYGALCGLMIPILNSVLTGMPPMYPMLPMMAGELLTYGFISGLLFNKTKLGKIKLGVYPALIGAMICGRVVYGLIFQLLAISNDSLKAVWGAVLTGLPGIVIQLILVPSIIVAVKYSSQNRETDSVQSAINLINEGTATCVIIKSNKIVKTEYGRGIAPMIAMYESGILNGSYVVDKIIGKAAAMIITLGGAKGCYGETMSKSAYEWLKNHNIDAAYGHLYEIITNREGNGICPMEETVQNISSPEEAIEALKNKLAQLRENQK